MNLRKHLSRPIFSLISRISQKTQTDVYVIGGAVRDILLNRKKIETDIDFVCIESGIKFAKYVARELPNNINVKYFKKFGTAMIHFNGEDYEFVGARKESYRSESRKPIIENGTLEDDQKRRDFTINTMAISLNHNNYGELIDPFNGILDLKEKKNKNSFGSRKNLF